MLKISYNLESNTKFGFSRGTFIIYTVVADVLLFLRQFRSPKQKEEHRKKFNSHLDIY